MTLWDKPVIAKMDLATIVMGYVATVTTWTGFSYLLPTDTFGGARVFRVLHQAGGEVFWGVLLFTLGVLAFMATWLEWQVSVLEREHTLIHSPEYWPSRQLCKIIWSVVSVAWAFVGMSFFVTVPTSPGTASYVCLAILTQVVTNTARKRRDQGVEEATSG